MTEKRICAICGQETDSLLEKDGTPICGPCRYRISAFDTKRARRAERLRGRAEKAAAESRAGWQRASQMAAIIPLGQPILVGHHSETWDRRYRDRIHRVRAKAYRRGQEAEELGRRAEAAASNRAVSSDDPAALLKLAEKLAKLENDQAVMKAINAAVRKVRRQMPDDLSAQAEALAQMTNVGRLRAEKLLEPDFAGRYGVPDYMLRNNGAEIRRVKARMEELRQRAAARAKAAESVTVEERETGGVVIERDTEENRLRLKFPTKPNSAVIAALKQNGFHWSPSHQAWQRQLNGAAEAAAERVLSHLKDKEQRDDRR